MTAILEPWLTKNELRRRLGPLVGRYCGDPEVQRALHPQTLAKFEDEGLPFFVPPGKVGRRYIWSCVADWLITFSGAQIQQMDLEAQARRKKSA